MTDEEPRAALRWSSADLDRCEHGRHSIDDCFDCPGGDSLGNLFLISPRKDRDQWVAPDGRILVRIGTAVRGEPIWVIVKDKPREWQ